MMINSRTKKFTLSMKLPFIVCPHPTNYQRQWVHRIAAQVFSRNYKQCRSVTSKVGCEPGTTDCQSNAMITRPTKRFQVSHCASTPCDTQPICNWFCSVAVAAAHRNLGEAYIRSRFQGDLKHPHRTSVIFNVERSIDTTRCMMIMTVIRKNNKRLLLS